MLVKDSKWLIVGDIPHIFRHSQKNFGQNSSCDLVAPLEEHVTYLWDAEHEYNVVPPSDVCWFITPHNYSSKYHKP